MNEIEFMSALTEIDDEFLLEAELPPKKKPQSRLHRTYFSHKKSAPFGAQKITLDESLLLSSSRVISFQCRVQAYG